MSHQRREIGQALPHICHQPRGQPTQPTIAQNMEEVGSFQPPSILQGDSRADWLSTKQPRSANGSWHPEEHSTSDSRRSNSHRHSSFPSTHHHRHQSKDSKHRSFLTRVLSCACEDGSKSPVGSEDQSSAEKRRGKNENISATVRAQRPRSVASSSHEESSDFLSSKSEISNSPHGKSSCLSGLTLPLVNRGSRSRVSARGRASTSHRNVVDDDSSNHEDETHIGMLVAASVLSDQSPSPPMYGTQSRPIQRQPSQPRPIVNNVGTVVHIPLARTGRPQLPLSNECLQQKLAAWREARRAAAKQWRESKRPRV